VRTVKAAGLPRAVVSASRNCQTVLQAAGIEDLFDVRVDGVVAAQEGLAGKPAPDMFLAAARHLGVGAPQAAVYEDAVAGVEAGRAGGFGWVVGVDRLGHADALKAGGADLVVPDLGDLLGAT
jgi:HAD superfamily hydrolase (TIGR01509 family)